MRKRILVMFLVIAVILICVIAIAGIHYKKNAALYTLSESDDKSADVVIFNGQKYTTNHPGHWTAVKLDKRVGYISGHQNDNLLMFYSFFEHGLYTLKEDTEHDFLQIKRQFADKERLLLVKDGYEFPSPDTVDFDYFTLFYDSDNKITDQDLMRSLFDQYVNASDDQVFTYAQVKDYTLFYQAEFYTSEYPSLCFYMTIYYSDANKAFYMQREINEYIRLTDDCAVRFVRCLDITN